AGMLATIQPNSNADWLKQRDESFSSFAVLGDKKGDGLKVFENFSLGVVTNRDAWCCNASKTVVEANMERMIAFYNAEVDRFDAAHAGLGRKEREAEVDKFIDNDATKIKWTVNLKDDLLRSRKSKFSTAYLTRCLYRPFTNQWLYFNRQLNERVLQMPRIF